MDKSARSQVAGALALRMMRCDEANQLADADDVQ